MKAITILTDKQTSRFMNGAGGASGVVSGAEIQRQFGSGKKLVLVEAKNKWQLIAAILKYL